MSPARGPQTVRLSIFRRNSKRKNLDPDPRHQTIITIIIIITITSIANVINFINININISISTNTDPTSLEKCVLQSWG